MDKKDLMHIFGLSTLMTLTVVTIIVSFIGMTNSFGIIKTWETIFVGLPYDIWLLIILYWGIQCLNIYLQVKQYR